MSGKHKQVDTVCQNSSEITHCFNKQSYVTKMENDCHTKLCFPPVLLMSVNRKLTKGGGKCRGQVGSPLLFLWISQKALGPWKLGISMHCILIIYKAQLAHMVLCKHVTHFWLQTSAQHYGGIGKSYIINTK